VFAAAAATVEFLGHRVDQDGVRQLPGHVPATTFFPPPPQDVKQLQQFLGMVNFYRRFLPGIARTLQTLTDALKGAPKTLEWPPPPSEQPRQPWRPRYHWRTQFRTPCSLSPQTPQTPTSAVCFNS
jgi:hypothetical protein